MRPFKNCVNRLGENVSATNRLLSFHQLDLLLESPYLRV